MGPDRLATILRQIANKIDSSKNPSQKLVVDDLKRVIASLRVSNFSSHPATKDIEEALYGHSGGETDPNLQGSSIWWLVFNKIGMEDWTPISDYDKIEAKAKELGLNLDSLRFGQTVVKVDPKYYRPTEVDLLIGDASKARQKLGWQPKYDLQALVSDMMHSDLHLVKKDDYLKKGGFKTLNYFE